MRAALVLGFLALCVAAAYGTEADVSARLYKDPQCARPAFGALLPPLKLEFTEYQCYTRDTLPATQLGSFKIPWHHGLVEFPADAKGAKLTCSSKGEFVTMFFVDQDCTRILHSGKMPTECSEAWQGAMHAYVEAICTPHETAGRPVTGWFF